MNDTLSVEKTIQSVHYGNGVTFILTDKKTIVCTNLQTFLVKYDHRNHARQLERLRDLIKSDQMKSLSDLVTYCGFRPGGYKDQMYGLELVSTRLERHI